MSGLSKSYNLSPDSYWTC